MSRKDFARHRMPSQRLTGGQLGNVNLLFLIIFEVSIGQKVNMLSEVSKILNFHPSDLTFEEDFQIRSPNSSTNCF